jgi:hypothetical protein
MTRINVIPPHYMLDEWVGAHVRETLRPINKLRQGKYAKSPISGQYRLGKGHELWGAYHGFFLSEMWIAYKAEWLSRGGNGFDFDPSLADYPAQYINDYAPTRVDYRHNLARLCERFRNRKNPYHYKKQVIDTTADFLQHLAWVKLNLGVGL